MKDGPLPWVRWRGGWQTLARTWRPERCGQVEDRSKRKRWQGPGHEVAGTGWHGGDWWRKRAECDGLVWKEGRLWQLGVGGGLNVTAW